MIDYHKNLKSALQTIGIGVHYEMALTKETAVPCISYLEANNSSTFDGDTLGYSDISYIIKIWANDIGVIQKYALEVDKVLRPLGLKRVSSGELYDNNSTMIQKILTYNGIGFETY